MTIEQRIHRISNTSHIVYLEDMSVYQVLDLRIYEDIIFVKTKTNLLFQDLDVLTLEEAAEAERGIIELKKQFKID